MYYLSLSCSIHIYIYTFWQFLFHLRNIYTTLLRVKSLFTTETFKKESIHSTYHFRIKDLSRSFIESIINDRCIVVCCSLNKMHKLMSDYKKTLKDAGKNSRKSPRMSSDNIPQSQQNGAALPEEASTSSIVDKQSHCSAETSSKSPTETGSRRKTKSTSNAIAKRKRKLASEEEESIGELPVFKKCCLADREKHIENLMGQKEGTSEEFARRAEELRLQIEVSCNTKI